MFAYNYLTRPEDDIAPDLRIAMMINDVDGLIAEVIQAQPMHPAKRGTLLGRLRQVRANLEHLKRTPP